MTSLYSLFRLLVLVGSIGTGVFLAWDQIAYSMHWLRPTWGAGVGVAYLALLINVLFNNQFIIGRVNAVSIEPDKPAETAA